MDRTHHAHPESAWGTPFAHFDTAYSASVTWSTSQSAPMQPQAGSDHPRAPSAVDTSENLAAPTEDGLMATTVHFRRHGRLPPLHTTFASLASRYSVRNPMGSGEPPAAAPSELLRPQQAATAATVAAPVEAAPTEANLSSQPPLTARGAVADQVSPPAMPPGSGFPYVDEFRSSQANQPWFLNPFYPPDMENDPNYTHTATGSFHSSRSSNFHLTPQPSTLPSPSAQGTRTTISREPSSIRRRQPRVAGRRTTMANILPLIGAPSRPRTVSSRDREQFERDAQVLRGAIRTQTVASGAALRSLQSVEVKDLPEDERWCKICYNEYGEESPEGINEAPLRLPRCKHVFGDHCLKRWLAESDHCPYCRDKLPAALKRSGAPREAYREEYRQYVRARALMFSSDEEHLRYQEAVNLALAQSDSDDLDSDTQDVQETRPASSIPPPRPLVPQRRERRPAPVEPEDNQRRTRARLSEPDSRSHTQASTTFRVETARFPPFLDGHSESADQAQNSTRSSNQQQRPQRPQGPGIGPPFMASFASRYHMHPDYRHSMPSPVVNRPGAILETGDFSQQHDSPQPMTNPLVPFAGARPRQSDPSALPTMSNDQGLLSETDFEVFSHQRNNDGVGFSHANH